MLDKLKRKVRERRGFTLAETLMTVLILLMVSVVMATGIPTAANALRRVVDCANAELLLSTTMTRLRSELGTARSVEAPSGTTIDFVRSDGSQTSISLEPYSPTPGAGPAPGVYLWEYKGVQVIEGEDGYRHLLVSEAASNKNLYATYDSVEYADGVITFRKLEVKKGTATLTSIDEFQVRVIGDV